MQNSASEDFGELASATPSQGMDSQSGMSPLALGAILLVCVGGVIGARSVSGTAPAAVSYVEQSHEIVRRLKVAQMGDIVVTKYDTLFRAQIDGRDSGIVIVSCSNTRRITVDFTRSPILTQVKRVVGPADADYAALAGNCAEQRSPLRP